jgi:phenylpyruvate tautomerase PptA (4-oxalocrotonate tautomerase family)
MPTYVCELPPHRFNAEQKQEIATAISQRHSEATGAPPFFVQVIVDETRSDRYLGGRRTGEHVWLRGDIRAGRTAGVRTQMMLKIMEDVARITRITSDNIWVYVCNLEPTDMVEIRSRAATAWAGNRLVRQLAGETAGVSARPGSYPGELHALVSHALGFQLHGNRFWPSARCCR